MKTHTCLAGAYPCVAFALDNTLLELRVLIEQLLGLLCDLALGV